MKTPTGTSLILVILLVSLSAYLRLVHSGIGCSDWPQCYGRIGLPATSEQHTAGATPYQQILDSTAQPLAWATPLHRLVASVLGLLVIALNLVALRQRKHRVVTLALLALTVFLAILGIQSGGLHQPAVIMGNLAGGFTLLGLLGWLWFSMSPPANGKAVKAGSAMTGIAIVLLCFQVLLGGFTSANFAATSCRTLPDCHGSWWPGPDLAVALDLTRIHTVTPSGQAIGGPEQIAIHKAHRLGALLATVVILLPSAIAIRSGGKQGKVATIILLLVVLEFTVGVASVLSGLPIGLAVAHNWLAALLLLALLKLLSLHRQATAANLGRAGH